MKIVTSVKIDTCGWNVLPNTAAVEERGKIRARGQVRLTVQWECDTTKHTAQRFDISRLKSIKHLPDSENELRNEKRRTKDQDGRV